jgi:hypothetical protein
MVGTQLFPQTNPGFSFNKGTRVFTIGSCFARNIEEHLSGYDVPTLRFSVPPEEWPNRPNGLLNEYNAGTIAQRIERAFAGNSAPADTVVEDGDGGFVDLLLPGSASVALSRAFARRDEIDHIYEELPEADVVIITLGLIEAWVDGSSGCYLNRMPPSLLLQQDPDRYYVKVMDVYDAHPLLESALRLLTSRGKKIILTVSPVPLNATFTGQDVTMANSFSKAVLRVCAERLSALPNVDYFPSYEIVMSGGLANFADDNIHVLDDVVHDVVDFMLSNYEA